MLEHCLQHITSSEYRVELFNLGTSHTWDIRPRGTLHKHKYDSNPQPGYLQQNALNTVLLEYSYLIITPECQKFRYYYKETSCQLQTMFLARRDGKHFKYWHSDTHTYTYPPTHCIYASKMTHFSRPVKCSLSVLNMEILVIYKSIISLRERFGIPNFSKSKNPVQYQYAYYLL